MIKKVLISLLVLVSLFTWGCGNKLKEGEVYDKEFKPAHTTTVFIPVVMSNGKSSTTVIVPYFYFYPDRYVIKIKAFKDDEWLKNEIYVSKDVYEGIDIGSEFKYVEGRDLLDEPYTREKK